MDELITKLLDYVHSKCTFLKKMDKQLTALEAAQLLEKFPLEDITKQLDKMDNWKGVEKKNHSVYLTLLKWFEMDIQRGFYTLKPHPNAQPKPEPKAPDLEEEVKLRKARFLQRYPVGTVFKWGGEDWEVTDENTITRLSDNSILPISMAIIKQQIQKRSNT